MKGFIILVTVIFCFSISYSQEEKKIIIPVYGEGVTELVNISFKEKAGLNELREISEYKILPIKR